MWIVRLALDRPYTFIVLALLILILSPVVILGTPTDIFPNINIPIVSVVWTYTGLNPEEMEGRLTSQYERVLTTTVDNIEHIESTSYNGLAVVKIFLQQGASLDTANAQVTAVSQFILRQMPPGTQPPIVLNFSASSVPILQLGLSGEGLSEQDLNDLALNFLRTQLVTVPGAVVPYPYGGKQREILVNLNPQQLQAKGLSPSDVLNVLEKQYLVLPSGTTKISQFEYDVHVNGTTLSADEINNIPIKTIGNATIYLRDVATVSTAFAPQTNIVRQNGRRGVLVSIIKAGNASTISVVNGVKEVLPRVAQTLPPQLKILPLADQSIFVKASVFSVIREAVIAAGLTAMMILLFLGSWRSTLIIAVSIPLSILSSIMALSFLGQTINIMTLGGLALAVGILVDDATVTIENIERFMEEGHPQRDAILYGAAQIAVPALVSTLSICIVFVPMFLLNGVARYLFIPLAEAVVFAMLASYILSRTLVPTMAMYLLTTEKHENGGRRTRNPLKMFQQGFEARFERLRLGYRDLLVSFVRNRKIFVVVFLGCVLSVFTLAPWLGQDFFPNTDSGQFIFHMRAKTGTRIEETARIADLVENRMRDIIPAHELVSILDNIGLPYSGINLTHTTSGVIGAADADIMVQLSEDHHPTADYVQKIRLALAKDFPGVIFYTLPADMITQILNFGLPAPIDVQITGADIYKNHTVADHMLERIRAVSGIVDARIQQQLDYPIFQVKVDRTKAQQNGLTENDVASSVLDTLSGSFQTAPMFFLNRKNGVNYNLATMAPQYDIQSLQDLQNLPITGTGQRAPAILADVATISRSQEMAAVDHYNIRRALDIYANIRGRDLGAVGADVQKIVEQDKKLLPRGSFVTIRGQLETMRASYMDLFEGLAFSILFVYLLIVVNFQSWSDAFIIISALPAALAGIVLFLFFTGTTLSVPALMGAIMCMGVATANSILVIAFAREKLAEHGNALQAAIDAGFTRFRPVLMTALAMIIGMVPMALGAGEGGEQNAPLGRAVIGGLMFATVATLIFVPTVFALLHNRKHGPGPVTPQPPGERAAHGSLVA
jgi:CzcA family heavy metal efflux pump